MKSGPPKQQILIVDDHPLYRQGMAAALARLIVSVLPVSVLPVDI